MATYRVTAPDGSVRQVTAPDNATPAQVQAYVQGMLRQQPEGQGVLNSLHGAAAAALDGALPGAGGVASGLLDMAGNAIAAPFSSSVDFDPAGSFRSGREISERHEERFKEDHPVLGKAATVAGFLGSLALPVTDVGLGVRGAQAALRARMVNAAANGALYGGAGGLLDSHAGSVGGALRDTAKGALAGAGVGSALPAVGRALAPIAAPVASVAGRLAAPAIDAAGRFLPGAVGRNLQNRATVMAARPADAQASRYLGHVMGQADIDSAGVMQELQRRQALGVPAAPADVNEHLRGAYGAATRRPGPTTMSVRRMIDDRQRQQTQRVIQHVQDTLGPTANVERQADALNGQARTAAAPLYAVSNAQPIPFTRDLQTLFSHPDARDALNIAGKQIWADAIRNGHPDPRGALLEHGLAENPDGTFEIANVPPMALYDHAKTAFDRVIFNGDRLGATQEMDRAGKATQDLRGRLLEIMDGYQAPHPDAPVPALPSRASEPVSGLPVPPPRVQGSGLNPYWKPARDAYAGPIQNRKAMELGADMARANATDAANRMSDMTGSQVDHFRLGHRSGLVEDLQNVGNYGNAAGHVNGSLGKREALATVHGQDATNALLERLQAEQDANQTWTAVRGNMPAGPEAADRMARQDQAWNDAGKGILSAVTGRPAAALGHIARSLANEPGRSAAIDDRVSTVLGSQDPAVVREAMAGVRKAQVADRAAGERATARAQQTAKVLGSRTGAGTATPPPGQALLGYGRDSDGSLYPVFGAPGTDLGPDYLPPDPNR